MKKSLTLSTIFITILLGSCSFFKYNSRQEALTACKNWKNENSIEIFIPSGSIQSKICDLEIETRQVLGSELKNPIPFKVYTDEAIEKNMKTVRYFKY